MSTRLGTCKAIARCRASEALYGAVAYYLRRHEVLAGKVNPLGSIFRKCKSMLIDVYRRETPTGGAHLEIDVAVDVADTNSPDSALDYDYKLKRRMLENRLAPKQRTVLMRHIDGANDGEISEELEMSPTTVRTTLSKARHNARKLLETIES